MFRFAKHLWHPGIIKFFLVCLMLGNLGLGNWARDWWHKEGEGAMSGLEFREKSVIFNTWLDSLAAVSWSKSSYGIADYFQDLRQIELKQTQIMGTIKLGMDIGSSMNFLRERAFKTATQPQIRIEQDRFMEWRREQNPVRPDESVDWPKVIRWFWLGYLFNMPLAFLYLLVVCIQNHRGWYYKENAWTPSPGRFVLAVIGYPVVFFLLARSAVREFALESVYRQTLKNVFGQLSQAEAERIQRLARSSVDLRQWRQMLRREGRLPRHSFGMAALATLVLVMVGRSEAIGFQGAPHLAGYTAIEQTMGHNLARMSIGDDDTQSSPGFSRLAVLPQPIVIIELVVTRLVLHLERVKPTRLVRAIEHIPLSAFQMLGFSHHTG